VDSSRFDYCFELQERLKPKNFWVTDFLGQRLMDVELTFCSGTLANSATVQRCAQYCEELLALDHPELPSTSRRLEACQLPASGKQQLRELLANASSGTNLNVTDRKAYEAVSAFLHLVFARSEG
jgi:hypothetical protein